MKKQRILFLLSSMFMAAMLFVACEGPMGPAGADGTDGLNGTDGKDDVGRRSCCRNGS